MPEIDAINAEFANNTVPLATMPDAAIIEALPASVNEALAVTEETVLTCAAPFTNPEAFAEVELEAAINAPLISTSEGKAVTALAADTSALPLSNS
tara:strand:- start:105 stop:392 length:288 start_codon:yes stop_codon:yes gene_type:complete